MPVMEISVVPVGSGSPSVSKYVAAMMAVLEDETDIRYELNAMGTVVEADSLEKLFAVAQKMHSAVLAGDIQRVLTSVKIDDRRDKPLSMLGKIESVYQWRK